MEFNIDRSYNQVYKKVIIKEKNCKKPSRY